MLFLIRGQIDTLKANVDQLTFVDISILWSKFPIPDAPMFVPPVMPSGELY